MGLPRISRPCYDKYRRCPGWAGGGMRYARRERCDGGNLAWVINYDDPWWRWKTHRCPVCGVIVLPDRIRHLDPTWYLSKLRTRIMFWRMDLKAYRKRKAARK